jgi:hypothetical protein
MMCSHDVVVDAMSSATCPLATGTNTSGASPGATPKKAGGVTPTIV